MTISVVRLGSKRRKGEGLRIGTVRKPPRGVSKTRYALDDWFDVWFPNLAPSPATMKLGLSAVTDTERARFFRKFRAEMAVHGKYGQPCPVCGTEVRRIAYAENECNYCPTCQTGGRLLADRALSRLLKEDWPRNLDEWEEHFQVRQVR